MWIEDRGKEKNIMDRFLEFPIEILLKILSCLEIVELIKFSRTSKRIRIICFDNSLWQNINLSKKRVPTEFLQKVIAYGCKYINLNEAKITGTLQLDNESQLENLDLSGCTAENQSVFEELLKSCHYLQKLTLTQKVKLEVMSQLTSQNGKTLQVLNCWQGIQCSSGWNPHLLELSTIECIIKNCTELKELTFWSGMNRDKTNGNRWYYCGICDDGIDYLVNNIPPEIEKFDFGNSAFGEEQINILVTRCTKLKELGLLIKTNVKNDILTHIIDTILKDDSITHIVDHLKPTLEKLVIYDAGKVLIYKSHSELSPLVQPTFTMR